MYSDPVIKPRASSRARLLYSFSLMFYDALISTVYRRSCKCTCIYEYDIQSEAIRISVLVLMGYLFGYEYLY